MGGSDQWGNIVTGTELIRRKSGGEAFAFTCPLVTRSDGGKFGKTEKGNIWLDPAKTTPFQFYQFWLNATDMDAVKWIKMFTFLGKPEIESMVQAHLQKPEARALQKALAKEITVFVHGVQECENAIQTTEKLFANQTAPAESLTDEDLKSLEGVVHFEFSGEKIREGMDIVSFLAETGAFPSKGEARRMIQSGGVSINRNKVEDITMQITPLNLLHEKYILVQKGKKSYFLIRIG